MGEICTYDNTDELFLISLVGDGLMKILEKWFLAPIAIGRNLAVDMAGNMGLIAKKCFSNVTRVTDRFHVQKLALEALQEIRIKHRSEAMDFENQLIIQAKSENKT